MKIDVLCCMTNVSCHAYRFHTLTKEVRGSFFDDAVERDFVRLVDESIVENAVDLVDPQADEFPPILR